MASLTIASTIKLPSGNLIPRLGFGVYKSSDAYASTLAALKHGYRYIDTAEAYQNEEEVGRAIRDSGLKREDIFITTKVLNDHADPGTAIQESLKRLGVDYVDLHIIHSAHGGKDARIKTYQALMNAKAQGIVRDIGVSNFNTKHLGELRDAGLETPAVNQVELHPFSLQAPIVEYCVGKGILMLAYCPVIRGDFSDPVLQEISKKVNKAPPQVLVRWSLQRGFVPLPKSSNPERIASNADVYDFELSEEDMNALNNRPQAPISWNPVDVD